MTYHDWTQQPRLSPQARQVLADWGRMLEAMAPLIQQRMITRQDWQRLQALLTAQRTPPPSAPPSSGC